MKALRLAIWGVVAAFAALLSFLLWQAQSGHKIAALDIGGPFALASSKGGVVTSESLKGKPYVMFFGFTHCPVICPTSLADMNAALTELGDDGKEFRIFFVTVDPERDTVDFLATYVGNFDQRIEGLIPKPEELPALAKAFRVFYEKVPTSDGSYTMNHTATTFLFDGNGQFAGTIAFEEDPKLRVAKLRRLVAVAR